MQFTVDRDVLEDAISWGSRAVPQHPAIPVLSGVRLSVADETLVISAFDYETSAKAQVPARVDEPGETLVSGRLLSDISKLLPAKPVNFKLVNHRLEIRCGSANYSLMEMSVDEYPRLPNFPEVSGTVDAGNFSTAVNQVAFAASKEESLPLLSGVMVQIDGANMTLMATDRYRLAMRQMMWHPANPDFKAAALIRAKVIADVGKTMTSAGDLSLAISDSGVPGQARTIGFAAGERMTTTSLMEGDYPPVATLFPKETTNFAVVNRRELIDATRRMNLVAERNTPIRLSFADGALTLSAGSGDDALASEAMQVHLEGEDITTAFNPNYLKEGLNAITHPYVRLSFVHPSKPAVLTGQAELDGQDDTGFRYLLMPIRFGL